MRVSKIMAAFVAVTLLWSGPINAREPIGKAALQNIVPLEGTRQQAERGLAGREIQVMDGQDGTLLLWSDGIMVGICGVVYTVTRQLGNGEGDGMAAVMALSAMVGPPTVQDAKVVGGAQGLSFFWDALPEYSITVIKGGAGWAASEAISRPELCQ